MYHTAIFSEAIETAIGLAAESDLVKQARLWPTRFNLYWDDKSAPVKRRKVNELSLCDAMVDVLKELGMPCKYAYVEDMWKRFNRP